jgi:D-beta-D-heptose 7-phosphate kinase/D-beta-D-heptose 1-phosphate adenosyltransferase
MANRIIVNGTFDIVHVGHIELLNYAKSLGNFLIVAIDSDERVKQLKGKKRPFNNQFERQTLLSNLKSVDEVKVFHTDNELLDIIKSCDMMVKGSDYKGKNIIGEQCIEVIFYDRIEQYSSTEKIKDISSR